MLSVDVFLLLWAVCVSADLEEGHRIFFLQEVVSMHSSPLHHQADHPALVVQHVVHPLLLAALRGLGVVGAQRVKDESNRRRQRFHLHGQFHRPTKGKQYTAERILGH